MQWLCRCNSGPANFVFGLLLEGKHIDESRQDTLASPDNLQPIQGCECRTWMQRSRLSQPISSAQRNSKLLSVMSGLLMIGHKSTL